MAARYSLLQRKKNRHAVHTGQESFATIILVGIDLGGVSCRVHMTVSRQRARVRRAFAIARRGGCHRGNVRIVVPSYSTINNSGTLVVGDIFEQPRTKTPTPCTTASRTDSSICNTFMTFPFFIDTLHGGFYTPHLPSFHDCGIAPDSCPLSLDDINYAVHVLNAAQATC